MVTVGIQDTPITMVTVGIQDTPTTMVTVGIQDTPITMEIDTGSSVTLITKADFLKTLDTCDTLKTPSVILTGYGGNKIKCIGEKEMKIQIGEQEDVCIVRVVDADGPSLLGRDIMTKFSLPWKTIFKITRTEADIISQYPKLFEKGLGKLKDTQVSLHVCDESPIFQKARPVPFAIRDKYEAALNKLVEEDIIENHPLSLSSNQTGLLECAQTTQALSINSVKLINTPFPVLKIF